MKVNVLAVGNMQVKNNIFIAPMAGYTDFSIRNLQLEMGAGLAFTELVSAKGLMYGGKGSKELLYCDGKDQSTVVQIFGSEEYFMRSACESEYLKPFKIIDVNMGCPVPKVFKNGEGSALLLDIKKAESIIKECVKSGKIITVKIRTGQKIGDDVARDFAIMAENAGASLITIHGRVREAYYSGEVDFHAIEKAKKAVKIPVIANGGIFTVQDADKIIDNTGADGVMLARGILSDPFLVEKLLGKDQNLTLKQYIINHINLMLKNKTEQKVAVEFRKFTPYYFKGMTGVKEIKNAINQAQTAQEIIELIDKNL